MIDCKKQKLLLNKAIVIALFITLLLPITGNALTNHKVNLPNGEYVETSEDMSVKVKGADIKLNRSWEHGRWQLNPTWSNLRLIHDKLNQDIKYIDRAGSIYTRSGSGNIYILNQYFIRKTDTGWQWYDRIGNWINYDNEGRLTAYGNANHIQAQFKLDNEGRRLAIYDANNQLVYRFEYDDNDYLTKVIDRSGRTVNYLWKNNLLTKVIDVLGYEWSYKYDNNGQIIQRIEPDGGKINITYDFSNKAQLSSMRGKYQQSVVSNNKENKKDYNVAQVGKLTDKLGNSTIWNTDINKTHQTYTITIDYPSGKKEIKTYNRNGHLINSVVNGHLKTKVEWDGKYLKKIFDASGLQLTIQYNNQLQPIVATYADGSKITLEYDYQLNLPIRFINRIGTVYEWQYDKNGNILKAIEAVGKPEQRTTYYSYNEFGQMIQIIKEDMNQKISNYLSYDEFGNIKTIKDGEDNLHHFEYTVQGLISKYIDPLGHNWLYDYDANGVINKKTDPRNNTTLYTSNAFGQITKKIDPLGRETNYQYVFDNNNYQIHITDALGGIATFNYDYNYRLIQEQSPLGLKQQRIYDKNDLLTEYIDQEDNRFIFEYDDNDLLTTIQYPTYRQTYQYNRLFSVTKIQQIIDEQHIITTNFNYDANRNPVSITKPGQNTSLYEYDAFGNQIKEINALGGITTRQWNYNNQLISVVDANGNKHTFEYDNNGNLIKQVLPTDAEKQFVYNAIGLITKETDAENNIIQYQYNASRQLISKSYTAAGKLQPEQTIDYIYNAAGELIEIIQSGTTNSRISYTLDKLGRKIKEEISYGKNASAITTILEYRYDSDGNLIEMTYPDRSKTNYHYNKGLLQKLILANQQDIQWQQYQWDKAKNIQYPGILQTLNYNGLLEPLNINVNTKQTNLMTQSYQYDDARNVSVQETKYGKINYQYDILGRLTKAEPSIALQKQGLPIESYTYDLVGNRIGSAHQSGTWKYTKDNQLVTWGKGDKKTTLEYSLTGNIIRKTTNTEELNYHYDATNRLIKVTSEQQLIASYQYDAMGRRISKTVGDVTTYFIYSNEGLIAELNEEGIMQVAYGWAPNSAYGTSPLWIAFIDNNETLANAEYHYLYLDHLGTPQIAVNKQGEITWRTLTDSFGKAILNENNQITMNLRLPGQYYDQETGTHYNYMRDYQPITGRYIQRDPAGLTGGLNHYAYANNNPLIYIDPTGENAAAGAIIMNTLLDGGKQLAQNTAATDGNLALAFICIDWGSALFSGAMSAVPEAKYPIAAAAAQVGGSAIMDKLPKLRIGDECQCKEIDDNPYLNAYEDYEKAKDMYNLGKNIVEELARQRGRR